MTIVAIHLVGDRLRDVLNPRLASHYGAWQWEQVTRKSDEKG